jgi:signal transduction histidine kinase/ActR/RegA family two-component response regulator
MCSFYSQPQTIKTLRKSPINTIEAHGMALAVYLYAEVRFLQVREPARRSVKTGCLSLSSHKIKSESTSQPSKRDTKARMQPMDKQRLTKLLMWSLIGVGAVACLFSAFHLPIKQLDLRFLLLASVTIGISSRVSVKIPHFTSQISVSDTFIFLTLLLYDGETAILLAAIEALLSSMRFSKKPIIILFNSAVIALSTFLSTWTLRLCFGNIPALPRSGYSSSFITAICLMALVQYATNSGLIALASALKTDQPFWTTWKKNYLWTSLTYFAGASAAGMIAKLFGSIGLPALIITTPILLIIFVTYKTYLKNVETAAAQAAQAERHVEELNHYIIEQEQMRQQLSQFEKLSALGELASGVAHDFNNTLAGILGRAQLLQRTSDPEKIKRGLSIIIKSAEDGAKTVKRIQDFARQRRDHDFEPVDVGELLLDISEVTQPYWKDRPEARNVHINLDLQIRSNAMVLGDDSELREVLVNMVFNAVDAMPEGGQIILSTMETDGYAEISVNDTGSGMSPEVRARIFDPFFTTKGKAGLGLGLAVSFGIITRHQGTIEVESEAGRGTTFRIRIPVTQVAAKDQSAEVEVLSSTPLTLEAFAPAQSLQQNLTTILVVDDEVQVRELLHDILESEGYNVVLAEGGREALLLFDAGNFDGVFTDIGMPGMSGWELARAIRERNQQIPLAVITGWGEAVGSDDQKKAQVDWVVTKPFSADRILELAREVSQRREAFEGVNLIAAVGQADAFVSV